MTRPSGPAIRMPDALPHDAPPVALPHDARTPDPPRAAPFPDASFPDAPLSGRIAAEPAGRRTPGRASPSLAWLPGGGLALMIYGATRVVQLIMIAWLAHPAPASIKGRLLAWDGGWFVRVATEGYPHTYTYGPGGEMVGNGLAFFPLYPLLIRALHATGVDAGWAAIVVSWLAGAAAAVLLYLLGVQLAVKRAGRSGPGSRADGTSDTSTGNKFTPAGRAGSEFRADRPNVRPAAGGTGPAADVPADPVTAGHGARTGGRGSQPHRVGLALVVLFCAQPMSVVLSMGYSEALFTALVVGMLYAAGRDAYLVAGVLGLAAGLTRPTGLAAGVALAVAAGLAVWAGRPPARPVIGAALGLAGVPLYLLWVAHRVGDAGAWFTIQTAGWGTTIDWGASVWDFLYTAAHQGTDWVQMSTAAFLIAAMLAAIAAFVRRTWPPLLVYGLIALGLVVGQAGYFHSKPRLLVPVLLILVPPAFAAARARPRVAALWLTGYALFGLWYGAYMLTVWHFTI